MDTVADRLRSVLGTRSKSEFARSLDVREGTVRSWLDGGSLPAAEALVSISGRYGVSIDWLLTGRGSQKTVGLATENATAIDVDVALIDQLSWSASAGGGNGPMPALSPEKAPFPKIVLDQIGLRPSDAALLRASGRSMEPTISDGDPLIADIRKLIPSQITDGRIYVLSIDDLLFVKRLRKSVHGWMMASDNRDLYPEEPLPSDRNVIIHGLVVWAGKQL